jgi:hypothetical protein
VGGIPVAQGYHNGMIQPVGAAASRRGGSYFQLLGEQSKIGFSRVSKPREGGGTPSPPFFKLGKRGPLAPALFADVSNKL